MNIVSLDINTESHDSILDDIPLLISDNDFSDDDSSHYSLKRFAKKDFDNRKLSLRNEVKSSEVSTSVNNTYVKNDFTDVNNDVNNVNNDVNDVNNNVNDVSDVNNAGNAAAALAANAADVADSISRNQIMTLIVKYIGTKINNSFPISNKKELPLDKFLLITISRLKLSLSNFLKSIIYLFRYMDIIYLLRYLNQSNNFAHHNSMDFELKKLIIGCFKLTILKQQKISPNKFYLSLDWKRVTGLSNQEINNITSTIIKRMNGKLIIRNIELIKLKTEIFRFVKMIQ